MTTATDIASLKARCKALETRATAVEAKNVTQETSITAIKTAATALKARVINLEAVKPVDYSVQFAQLRKEVDVLMAQVYTLYNEYQTGGPPPPDPSDFPPAGGINAMDYCHGDGVTDDRAHILAAIAAAGGVHPVYFYAHSYYLAANLAVPANTTLIGENAATTSFLGSVTYGSGCTYSGYTVVPHGAVFNVMDYGATHNGSTDDFGAFHDAVEAAQATGGTVYAPAGTYKLTGASHGGGIDAPNSSCKGLIYLPSNVTLLGDGATTILQDRSTTNSVSCIITTAQTNVNIKNLAIDVDAAHKAASADCIKMMGCSDSTIENVSGAGSYIGLNFSGCTDCTFTDVLMTSCGLGFSGRTTAWCAGIDGGADYMDIDNVSFSYCESDSADDADMGWGILAWKNQSDEDEMNAGTTLTNVTLDHCSSHDSYYSGAYFTNIEHLTITDSAFDDNWAAGMRLTDCTNYWVPQSPTTGFNTASPPPLLDLDGTNTARGSL